MYLCMAEAHWIQHGIVEWTKVVANLTRLSMDVDLGYLCVMVVIELVPLYSNHSQRWIFYLRFDQLDNFLEVVQFIISKVEGHHVWP
jgi:hypothetical protein